MTTCTICSLPCPGDDDTPEAWCAWCFTRYVAWEERRPLGRVAAPGGLVAQRALEVLALDAGRAPC